MLKFLFLQVLIKLSMTLQTDIKRDMAVRVKPPRVSSLKIIIYRLNLVLVAFGIQDTTTRRLFGLAHRPSTRSHVQPVGVDHAVLLEGRRVPLGTGDRVDVQDVHGVNLLKRATLGLAHEEVDDDEEDAERDGEDQTVEVVDLVGDEGGAEGDDEVEEPVGRRLPIC